MSGAGRRVCPKCGHVRAPGASVPDWQCPACGIAYHKYAAYLEQARRIVRPPAAGEPSPAIAVDGSVWSLVLANVLALAVAWHQDWSAGSLMILYWLQSVVIGVSNVFRILALDKFSTENFRMNGRHVDPTPAVKWQVAIFFAVHYGFFHFVYLMFLVTDARGEPLIDRWFWLCAAAFALNHWWSYRYNRDIDRQGTPNIGTLMFTPYVRIVPMHLTIIFGGLLGPGAAKLLLFGALKTGADVAMHAAEHAQLKKVRRVARASPG